MDYFTLLLALTVLIIFWSLVDYPVFYRYPFLLAILGFIIGVLGAYWGQIVNLVGTISLDTQIKIEASLSSNLSNILISSIAGSMIVSAILIKVENSFKSTKKSLIRQIENLDHDLQEFEDADDRLKSSNSHLSNEEFKGQYRSAKDIKSNVRDKLHKLKNELEKYNR